MVRETGSVAGEKFILATQFKPSSASLLNTTKTLRFDNVDNLTLGSNTLFVYHVCLFFFFSNNLYSFALNEIAKCSSVLKTIDRTRHFH